MNTPYVIFEIANTHGGKLVRLNKLIESFSDFRWPRKGLKFQVFHADTLALPDFSWYETYQELTQKPETWGSIIDETHGFGDVWLDVFDTYGAEILDQYSDKVTGVKLQASVLDNAELVNKLKEISLNDCKLVINVAGYSLTQVYDYVKQFSQVEPADLILQAGYQDYPTALTDTGLQKVDVLRAAFPQLPICFADHTLGSSTAARSVPALAVAAGCSFVEKHFCISRKDAIYDSYSSLEPDEVRLMLEQLRIAVEASSGPFVSPSEEQYLKKTYQTPVARKQLPAGSLVGKTDLLFRRTDQDGLTWPTIEKKQKGFRILNKNIEKSKTIGRGALRDARIGVVVACRMKSSRLEKKASVSLHGVPSVERCLSNCLMIKEADTVVLATSYLDEDSILADYTLGGRVEFIQGDPDDVISRYIKACDRLEIDVVVRVTADCPVVSPEITSILLNHHFECGADYTAVNEHAVGSAAEIYNAEALQRVIDLKYEAKYSEYMTWYLRNNPHIFKIEHIDLPEELIRDYRLTLDYPEDKKMFDMLFKKLDEQKSEPRLSNVFDIMDKNPSISKINKGLKLKYKDDIELISKLDRETKI